MNEALETLVDIAKPCRLDIMQDENSYYFRLRYNKRVVIKTVSYLDIHYAKSAFSMIQEIIKNARDELIITTCSTQQ